MSQQPSVEVTVALQALRSDAAAWDMAAERLIKMLNVIQNLQLGKNELSVLVSSVISETYANLQDKVAYLISGGFREFSKVAHTLRATADTYEREDLAGAHHFK